MRSPALISKPGFRGHTAPQPQLEAKSRAQIHDAAIVAHAAGGADVTRTIDHAECGAEDISVGNAPARMVENVTESREQLQILTFHDANVLENRRVPGKCVSIANEKNLAKTARSSVRHKQSRIGPAVRTNQTRIDRQKLRWRRSGSVERSQRDSLRVKEFLNLLQSHTGRQLNPTSSTAIEARARVVRVVDRAESARQLHGLSGVEDENVA